LAYFSLYGIFLIFTIGSSLLLNEFLKNHHIPLDELKNFLRKESNSPRPRGYFLHLFDGIDNFHFFKINF